MNSQTKTALQAFCFLGAIWDIVTTFNGMSDILGSTLFAVAATLFINGILFFTCIKLDNEFIQTIGGIALAAAFVGDCYTAYKGNLALGNIENTDGKIFISSILTIITVGSTIVSSYLIFRMPVIEPEIEDEKKKNRHRRRN